MREWLEMKKEIDKQAKHAKEYWGFGCLKAATTLEWDIGQEVYYTLGTNVVKGRIVSVNPSGMCNVQAIPKDDVLWVIHSTRLYTNVFYALKEAEHNIEMENKKKEPKKKGGIKNGKRRKRT